MNLDPQQLSIREAYTWMVDLITPRPIAWVSTVAIDGVTNLAPFSFFNGVAPTHPRSCSAPPTAATDHARTR